MLISDFLYKYYSDLKDKGINREINVPNSMIIQNLEDDWKEWKFSESIINKYDILKLEDKYKIKLPEDFKKFICFKQCMNIQIKEYTIFGVNELNPIENILNLFPENIILYGFIPIGQINDEDYISLNCHNGNVVSLAFDDFKLKKVLFENFSSMINFLNSKI